MPERARKRPSEKFLRNAQSSSERLDFGNDAADAEAFSAVRALLVGEEQNGLKDLRARMSDIERTTFDRDKRRDDVADVLGDALKQASLTDGDKIEDVLNPSIGEGIRHQLKNERPAMVAALVPMVGTLVAGAVGESIGKLSESINTRIEKLFSFDGLKLAMRAKMSGRSVNDMLLAELRNTEVERLYLFERKTEKLVFCWPKFEEDTEGADLSDAMADEILKAVFAFSSGILGTGDHGLRSIAIKDRHLVLQANDSHIVVIEVSGQLSDSRRGDLNDACFDILTFVSDLTGNLDDVAIDEDAVGLFAARIIKTEARSDARSTRRINPALLLGAALVLALVGYIGWRAYDGYRIGARADSVESRIVAAFPQDSLMLSVTPDRSAGMISVMGVALSEGDGSALRSQVAELAEPYGLDYNLVSGNPDRAIPRLSALENDLGTLRDSAARTSGALATIDAKATQAQARTNALWDAQRQLSSWVSSHAIFFTAGTAFRSDDIAGRDLDILATLLKRAPERPLRIIGYSDAIGSQGDNRKMALSRGERIAEELVDRGIPAERLIVLGRAGERNLISDRNGPNSPNRRTEFALGFVGE